MASPLIEQFRKGGVSQDVRLTAAAGLLPLKPVDQVELLQLLTRDRDEEVRQKSEASLMQIGAEDLESVFKDRGTNSKVLHFYGLHLENTDLIRLVIQNPSTEDETIGEMVPRLSTELLEIVVVNQTRLIRHPLIVVAAEANPSLNSDQRRRLNELRHDFKLFEEPEPPPERKPEPPALMDLGAGPPEDEAPPPASIEEAEAIYGEADDEMSEEEKEKQQSVIKELLGMNPPEKMMKALKGNREARMYLIRDRNRMVYAAVLNSPKLTGGDVEAISQMRNVSPEVLRTIGGNKNWTKSYNIRRELVKNPLTPIEISMRQIALLSSMDLKKLTRDRNVPEQVRRQATKLTRSSQ